MVKFLLIVLFFLIIRSFINIFISPYFKNQSKNKKNNDIIDVDYEEVD